MRCSESSGRRRPRRRCLTSDRGRGATLPRVDLIDDAVSALEAKLGAPQQYFEINATSQLVNLFVALNDGKVVQPWVYLDGELSSTEGHDANGFSFARTALDFDPDKVLEPHRGRTPAVQARRVHRRGRRGRDRAVQRHRHVAAGWSARRGRRAGWCSEVDRGLTVPRFPRNPLVPLDPL